MNRARRTLVRLERSPWVLAVIAALGATLIVPSALALFGPPEWLEAAAALGDARLGFALAALFVVSACALRFVLRRRRLREEAIDEEPIAPRREDAREVPATTARAHLR